MIAAGRRQPSDHGRDRGPDRRTGARERSRGRLPRLVILFLLAVAAGTALWGVTTLRNSAAPTLESAVVPARAGPFRLAYTLPTDDQTGDRLILHSLDGASPSVTVATFSSWLTFHARGSASPTGGRLAVLHVADTFGQTGTLSIVDLDTMLQVDAPQTFDLSSRIAWDAAGTRLALVRTRSHDDAGRLSLDVIEVDAQNGALLSQTSFDAVLDAAPVGYAPEASRLYVATVDQSGSTLWSVSGGSRQRIASFSPGRTRDWSLSPDGSRLAFVDVFGPGARSYAGSIFQLDARTVSVSVATSSELGAVWRPGSVIPDFGGPGGSLQLARPEKGAYLAPDSWSPDGSMLAARVYSEHNDAAGSLEVISAGYRVRLSDDPGASLLGWVGGTAR